MKTAKVTLTADTRGFKGQITEAKKLVDEFNKAINSMATKAQISNGGMKPFGGFASQEGAARARSAGIPGFGGGQANSGGGILSALTGGAGKLLAGAGLGVGLGALYNKRVNIARERLNIRALTGGQIGDETSQLGYNPAEVRAQQLGIAHNVGGSMSGQRLNELTKMSQQAERAYGVSTEQSANSMGAASRNGQDPSKYLSQSIGAAVAAGLEGSNIGKFLESSTAYLEEMSHGVNIDSESLNGFAASLSTMPFFKNDPSRAFEALKSLGESFQHGDRFQQAQGTRAILAGVPGASPAATEIRRGLGLFGGGDQQSELAGRIGKLGGGDLAKTLKMSGGDITQNIFKEIMDSTKGMSFSNRAFEFQQRSGMKGQAGLEVFTDLMEGKKVSSEKFKNAQMDPTERLNKTMEDHDKNILLLNTTISQAIESMSKNIFNPVASATGFFGLDKKSNNDTATDVAGQIGTAGTIGGAAAYLGAGSIAAPALLGAGIGKNFGAINDLMSGNPFTRAKNAIFGDPANVAPGQSHFGTPGTAPLDDHGEKIDRNTDATAKLTDVMQKMVGGSGSNSGPVMPDNAQMIDRGSSKMGGR